MVSGCLSKAKRKRNPKTHDVFINRDGEKQGRAPLNPTRNNGKVIGKKEEPLANK